MLNVEQLNKQSKSDFYKTLPILLLILGAMSSLDLILGVFFIISLMALGVFAMWKMKRSNHNLTASEISWLNRLEKVSIQSGYNLKYRLTRSGFSTISISPFFAFDRVVFIQRSVAKMTEPEVFYEMFLKTAPSPAGAKWFVRTMLFSTPLSLLVMSLAVIFFPVDFPFSFALKLLIILCLVGKLIFDSLLQKTGAQVTWLLEFLSYQNLTTRKYLIKSFRTQYQGTNLKMQIRKIAKFGQAAALVPDRRAFQMALVIFALFAVVYQYSTSSTTAKAVLKPTADQTSCTNCFAK